MPESILIDVEERFADLETIDETGAIDPMAVTVEAMKDGGIPLGEMIAQWWGSKLHHGRETPMLRKIPFSEARMTTHTLRFPCSLKKTDKQGTCLDGGPFHGLYRVQMRIAIDAMGGDNAPSTIIDGVALAVKNNPVITPVLVGPEQKLRSLVKRHGHLSHAEFLHTEDVVAADEKPSAALRLGKIPRCGCRLIWSRQVRLTLLFLRVIQVP